PPTWNPRRSRSTRIPRHPRATRSAAATAATPESSPRRTPERPVHDGAVIPSPDGDRRAAVMPGSARCELRTARLRLAPVAEHELDELLALHADPRAFAEDLTEPVTDRARMRWVLGRWRESWDQHGLGYLTVRAREAADGTGGAGAAAAGAADG